MRFSLGVLLEKEDVTKENWKDVLWEKMEPFSTKDHFIGRIEYSLDEAISKIESFITYAKKNKKYSQINELFKDNCSLQDVIAEMYDINSECVDINYDEEIVEADEYSFYGEFDCYDVGENANFDLIPLKEGRKHLFDKACVARIGDIAFKRCLSENEIEEIKKMFNENEAFAMLMSGCANVEEAIDESSKFVTSFLISKGEWCETNIDDVEDFENFVKSEYDDDDIFVLVDCHM